MKEVIKNYRTNIIKPTQVEDLRLCIILKGDVGSFYPNYNDCRVIGSVKAYHPVIVQSTMILIEHLSKKPMTKNELTKGRSLEKKLDDKSEFPAIFFKLISSNMQMFIQNDLRVLYFDDEESKDEFLDRLSKIPKDGDLLSADDEFKIEELIDHLSTTKKWTDTYNLSFNNPDEEEGESYFERVDSYLKQSKEFDEMRNEIEKQIEKYEQEEEENREKRRRPDYGGGIDDEEAIMRALKGGYGDKFGF